jgi:hypothetical protein
VKAERKPPLGTPKHIWKHNIKMGFQEIGWRYGLDRSGSGQGQMAGTFEGGDDISDSIK